MHPLPAYIAKIRSLVFYNRVMRRVLPASDDTYLYWTMFIGEIAGLVHGGQDEWEAIRVTLAKYADRTRGTDDLTPLVSRIEHRLADPPNRKGMPTALAAFELLMEILGSPANEALRRSAWKRHWKIRQMYWDYWHKRMIALFPETTTFATKKPVRLGNGRIMVDRTDAHLSSLSRTGDQSYHTIKYRQWPGLRAEVSLTWEAGYVEENYPPGPRQGGQREVRQPGEVWDFDERPDQALRTSNGHLVVPRVVITDHTCGYHSIVRHWAIGDTFVVVSTVYPGGHPPADWIPGILAKITVIDPA